MVSLLKTYPLIVLNLYMFFGEKKNVPRYHIHNRTYLVDMSKLNFCEAFGHGGG